MSSKLEKYKFFGTKFTILALIEKCAKRLYLHRLLSENILIRIIRTQQSNTYKTIRTLMQTKLADVKSRAQKYQDDHQQVPRIIWTLWLQGVDSAPEVVKLCIRSMQTNSGVSDVRVVTADNLSDYIEIPTTILDAYKAHQISAALYSDYIRFAILHKHGGIWLDSTCFCSNTIPDQVFDQPWYSPFQIKPFRYHGFPSMQFPYISEWVSYCLASKRGDLFSGTMCELLESYISLEIPLVDYFLVFYLSKMARTEVQTIHLQDKNRVSSNTGCEMLGEYLMTNRTVEPQTISALLNDHESWVHKLSYKSKLFASNTVWEAMLKELRNEVN
jgi:hypothetical protein